MNMGSIGKERKRLAASFKYATQGLLHVIKKERNMQIHLSVACIVVFLAYFFSVSKIEWILLLLCIGIVISLESVNTAIERTVDLCTKDMKPLAKQAKDTAAAAVFVFAIISVIIGLIIFTIPFLKFLNLL
ncbi:undecaprenol kinase [Schinkia azotoformans MEV2011]|uniref:Diacylglycerol kinase n=2 Tax=Schinkia azotoformans TaxID=1454 RepID=K6DTX2_SCHAZ|nr:diacylglycerol kinase family protein [Schinkia azotoformans]EKN64246.1 diacylglycerol kinase [Schinkia azotoformans LMG 9581]KEF38147.1 undecaprenol kinase [Schinkia azotoformans MEV2011]MEC1640635.1 diacylglycerol kinase family protein [Schinkia azotoformans]MEC1698006.1 diacylglycerol kinase family protein [Schinkia azotoformans]MEC1716460.1 diacylglycerol kinase family protein [Schinkia azotoformans]